MTNMPMSCMKLGGGMGIEMPEAGLKMRPN